MIFLIRVLKISCSRIATYGSNLPRTISDKHVNIIISSTQIQKPKMNKLTWVPFLPFYVHVDEVVQNFRMDRIIFGINWYTVRCKLFSSEAGLQIIVYRWMVCLKLLPFVVNGSSKIPILNRPLNEIILVVSTDPWSALIRTIIEV